MSIMAGADMYTYFPLYGVVILARKKNTTPPCMPDTKYKIKQFRYETDAWRRMLAFLLQENAILKTRLAELVHESKISDDFLEMAEQYQNHFIQNDQVINFVRLDIAELDKLLLRNLHENGLIIKAIARKQKNLRKELTTLETTFNEIKIKFNNYLAETL
jgi:hypothetical protein